MEAWAPSLSDDVFYRDDSQIEAHRPFRLFGLAGATR
jgi:hypothetical protein